MRLNTDLSPAYIPCQVFFLIFITMILAMKKNIVFYCLFLLSTCISAQRPIDVQSYHFNIGLNDNNDSIRGKAIILIRFTETTNTFDLDLAGVKGNGKGMHIYKVSGQGVRGINKGEEHSFKVILIKSMNAGDTATYTVDYGGIPADGLIISKNKYGQRSFFADNWPDRGRNWLPCNDVPADKAAVTFSVTAPQHYQVVANGIQYEETNLPDNMKRTLWKEDVPISTKVMVIGVARFAVQLSAIVDGCIPVYSWVYPEDRDKGFYDYAQASEILPFFIKKVGPYAYKKLANVESKTTFGGLENANTIFYSETSVTGTRKSESLIAHEIAHQWFGNMATEKTFAHLWLSEGFATYMAILYLEDKYGWDTARAMLIEDRDQAIAFSKRNSSAVVDNNADFMQLLNANSYQKGGWALHMLRRQLGDSIFWKSIRAYYSTYAGGTADTDDLRKVFEKTSGKNLKKFFDQWLYSPGQPELIVGWKYDEKNKKVLFDIKQEKTKFEFPLQVAIKNPAAKIELVTIMIKEGNTSASITVKEKPALVILDPEVSLLYSGTVREIK